MSKNAVMMGKAPEKTFSQPVPAVEMKIPLCRLICSRLKYWVFRMYFRAQRYWARSRNPFISAVIPMV